MNLPHLTRNDLMSLEQYSTARKEFRAKVMEHKRNRSLARRAERDVVVRRPADDAVPGAGDAARRAHLRGRAIQEELDAYNPLIPDGRNWKATFLLEFPDADERRQRLAQLKGVEDRCWVQVAGFDRVWAIADEDLERENDDKTSSVHFLRFELSPQMCAQVKAGAAIGAGIDHDNYRHAVTSLPQNVRESLVKDLA